MASAATLAAIKMSVGATDMTKSSTTTALRGVGQRLMSASELRNQIDDYLAGTAGFTGVAVRIVRACTAAQPDGVMDAARAAAQDSIVACHEDADKGTFAADGDFVPVYRRDRDDVQPVGRDTHRLE